MKIFAADGKLLRLLGTAADLFLLNLIFLLFSAPIFTAGASVTALNSVLMRRARGDDGKIFAGFWAAFRQNFGQATLLWLATLAACALLAVDIRALPQYFDGAAEAVLGLGLLAAALVFLLTESWLFFLQARYRNHLGGTVRNALAMAVANLPVTVTALAIGLLLPAATVLLPSAVSATLFLWLSFGFSLPAYLGALMLLPRMERTFEAAREKK